MTKPRRLTFLTRYYPPSPNINGESVCDMVQFLKENYNIESRIITLDRDFEGLGGTRRQPVGDVIKLKTLFKSRHPIFRFFTFLYDGYVLTKESLKYKDELIIVTSSPPMLPMWSSLIYGKNIRWALWSLDLFPEGFMATGKIKATNPFYKWVYKKTYSSAPTHLITLGPKQSEHLQNEFKKAIPSSILPCGVFFYQDKNENQPSWYDSKRITIGYCGNVHDPHNPDFIKAMIDNINPELHHLVLALYGTKAPALIEYAKDKTGVTIVENVPRNQLHFIDVHMVSLTKKWTHIAVPSKAVSAVSMGRPILFCGSKESDNWHLLKDAAWFIEEDNDLNTSILQFLNQLSKSEIDIKKEKAIQLNEKLKATIINTYKEVFDLI